MKRWLFIPLTMTLAGCASIPSTSLNAQKAAISTCAAAAAYKDAIVIGNPKNAGKAQTMLLKLQPFCDSKTPPAALSKGEEEAFRWLREQAQPYIQPYKPYKGA